MHCVTMFSKKELCPLTNTVIPHPTVLFLIGYKVFWDLIDELPAFLIIDVAGLRFALAPLKAMIKLALTELIVRKGLPYGSLGVNISVYKFVFCRNGS